MRKRKNKDERWTWKEIIANIMVLAMAVAAILFVWFTLHTSTPPHSEVCEEISNIVHEYVYEEDTSDGGAEQLPEPQPDLSAYETYDPLKGYLGMASGFGGVFYFLKKRDKKLDSIDKKQDKIDNRLSVIESKVDRNIDDIQGVRNDLHDADRIKRLMKDKEG